jgi:hypothetical protein
MDNIERLAQQAAEAINGGEFNDGKWYTEGQRQAWRKAMTPAADEIERLRSQMDLFDPSTTQEMAAAALNFANDEIKRLQERNHALRKALQLIAAPSKVVVKGEEAVVALRLVLSSHRRTALKALGEGE